jgi:hypothetical protein
MSPDKQKSIMETILEDLKKIDLKDFDFEEPDEAQLNNK